MWYQTKYFGRSKGGFLGIAMSPSINFVATRDISIELLPCAVSGLFQQTGVFGFHRKLSTNFSSSLRK